MVQLSHPYMTAGKTVAMTSVGKVMHTYNWSTFVQRKQTQHCTLTMLQKIFFFFLKKQSTCVHTHTHTHTDPCPLGCWEAGVWWARLQGKKHPGPFPTPWLLAEPEEAVFPPPVLSFPTSGSPSAALYEWVSGQTPASSSPGEAQDTPFACLALKPTQFSNPPPPQGIADSILLPCYKDSLWASESAKDSTPGTP